ncbi:MAG: S8 family serine peptidase [Phycisphaerales bacterium]|nr:S8 family serine peptidase [Phycisphaerales bacterium]
MAVDRIGVRLRPGVDPREAAWAIRSVFPAGSVASVRPALRVAPQDSALASRLGLDREFVVEFVAPMTPGVADAASAMRSDVLEGVEAVPVGHLTDDTSESLAPADPLFALQYSLENTGQPILGTPGSSGADINAIGAWGMRGTAGLPIVAVLDSGIAPHPDLAGILLQGWNIPLQNTETGDEFSSHGTHVGGIIAAIHNNGAGIAGVAPECRLLPVKVTNLFGQTDAVWLSEGIVWAADRGAHVLNISIGLSSGTSLLRGAVQYAAAKGCVIVCSAGNTPTLPVVYPARYPETIAVSATDNRDAILNISASGPEIDMAAPGWNVLSTWHLWSSPNTYDFKTGTSQAAPVVAGVAALVRATRPELPGTTVRTILSASCRDLGAPGRDPVYGYGRIDAALAVANAKAFGGASGGTTIPGAECPADLNKDGVLSNADFFLFLDLFAARDPRADFSLPHGVFNSDDFFAFSAAYIAGCGG